MRPLYPFIAEELRAFSLPSVLRDFQGQSVRFLTEIYAFSLLAYLPDLLTSIHLLEDGDLGLPVACLARNLLEWTANACYVSGKLAARKPGDRDAESILLLERVLSGNRWLQKDYKHLAIPNPLPVNTLVAEYVSRGESDFGDADAKESYGFFSELTHPNGMALGHYQRLVGNKIIFDRREVSIHFGERVTADTISILGFIHQILRSVDEIAVSRQIVRLLNETIDEADS